MLAIGLGTLCCTHIRHHGYRAWISYFTYRGLFARSTFDTMGVRVYAELRLILHNGRRLNAFPSRRC